MATAKKLPSGSWRCLVYDYTDEHGKRHYASFTSDDTSPRGKRDAEFQAAQYALHKKKKTELSMSIEEALQGYISSKEATLSPSTIKSYKCTLNSLLKETYEFTQKDIYKLDAEDVQKVINRLSLSKKPKTIRNIHGLLNATLQKYRPDFILKTTLPQKQRPELYIPTDNDIIKLLMAAENTELEIPIMLAAFGTMRRGEICALSINDISGNTAHIHKNLVLNYERNYIEKTPKTYSSDRFVVLPEFVIKKINEKGYITKLLPEQLTRRFEKLLDNIDIPHFRFHDLRHYSASVLHALNVPDAYIMERGGWSSDTVLKQVYRHAMSDRQKEMNAIANSHFTQLCNTKCNTKEKSLE